METMQEIIAEPKVEIVEQYVFRPNIFICNHCGEAVAWDNDKYYPYIYSYDNVNIYCKEHSRSVVHTLPFKTMQYKKIKDIKIKDFEDTDVIFSRQKSEIVSSKCSFTNITSFTLVKEIKSRSLYTKDLLKLYKKHKKLSDEKLAEHITNANLLKQEVITTYKLVVDFSQPIFKDKVIFYINDKRAKGWKKNTADNFSMDDIIRLFGELDAFKDHCEPFRYEKLKNLLSQMLEKPYLEVLIKSNIPVNIYSSYDDRTYDTDKTAPHEILRLNKSCFKFYRDIINNGQKYRMTYHSRGNILEMLQASPELDVNRLIQVFTKLNEHTRSFVKGDIDVGSVDITLGIKLYDFMKYNNYDFKTLFKYLTEELRCNQGLYQLNNAIDTLIDYVEISQALDVPFEKYPKALPLEHSKITYLKIIQKNKYSAEMFQKAIDTNSKFIYSNDTYSILSPESMTDLKREGSILGHCVGTYTDKYIEYKSRIFFMRQNTDITAPYVTLELNKYFALVQSKGQYNRATTDKEKVFIKEWLTYVNKKIHEKEGDVA